MTLARRFYKVLNLGFLPGFLFWVLFLLVLEPDNVLRAIHAGCDLSFSHELIRIIGAACIGGAATPLVLHLTRRRPIGGRHRWRNLPIHIGTIAGLAFVLIISSCFAAAWAFGHRLLPTFPEIAQELGSNWTLLLFALTCLTAISHLVSAQTESPLPEKSGVAATPLCRVLVTFHGRRLWIAIAEVDWIESQGNYVTLHVGARAYWLRQTLSAFEAQLDSARFARIHRRTIVSLDRISAIQAEGNGDASIRLKDGVTLRASRNYRRNLRDRWLGFHDEATAARPK